MKSKIISIHSSGNGFIDANQETEALTAGLPEDQRLQLCLITEEMISLFRSVTGEVDGAEFWLEDEEGKFTFHLTAHQKLGNMQRKQLIQSTTSKTNEAAKGFLGKLREAFVQALSVGNDIDMYYSSSDYFLRYFRPGITGISAGKKNRYHHPGKKALKRLKKNGCSKIYCTSWRGAVLLQTDGKKTKVGYW